MYVPSVHKTIPLEGELKMGKKLQAYIRGYQH